MAIKETERTRTKRIKRIARRVVEAAVTDREFGKAVSEFAREHGVDRGEAVNDITHHVLKEAYRVYSS